MNMFLIYVILPVVMTTLTITSTWALPTFLPAESENPATEANPQDDHTTLAPSSVAPPAELTTAPPVTPDKPLKVQPLPQQKGRNIMFRNPANTNMILLGSIPQNHEIIADYPEPILAYRPLESFNYDYSPEMLPFEPVLAPEPVDNLRTAHVVVYPSEDFNDRDIATAESNIVFRPLFAYRHQTAQKRKVYSRRSTAPSASSSSNRNEQRGSQGYPYRYPSYGYPNYYPSYYHNAQFDTVA